MQSLGDFNFANYFLRFTLLMFSSINEPYISPGFMLVFIERIIVF